MALHFMGIVFPRLPFPKKVLKIDQISPVVQLLPYVFLFFESLEAYAISAICNGFSAFS